MMEQLQSEIYNGHRIASAFHDAGGRDVVVFCHGYRGTSVGPNRFFVRAARKLLKSQISSLRFDQYGSGNSDGDFHESSFIDWMATTKAIVSEFQQRGYRVGLFGQSMGGAAAIGVASDVPNLTALVAWVPDPNVDTFQSPPDGIVEESGQIVRAAYWQEAHDADIATRLRFVAAPTYIVQCGADDFVDKHNRDALVEQRQSNHQIEFFDGYSHSSWTYAQSEEIIEKSVDFLRRAFG
jgi:alpha-beta hydrolase superfamily lysophospholipase